MNNSLPVVNNSLEKRNSSLLDKIFSLTHTKIALTSLLITLGASSVSGQTTTAPEKSTIEQVISTGDPQQDMKSLLDKYKVPSVDDMWDMSFKDMASMRYDLTDLLDKNMNGVYQLHPQVVQLRDELVKNISMLLRPEQKKMFEKDVAVVINRGISISASEKSLAEAKTSLAEAKTSLAEKKARLAELEKELVEIRKIAKRTEK